MINNVSLTGRITKDLEQRNTNSGKAFVNFTLAVDRRFKDQNGERQADFIQIQAWGKTAEILCKYASKGSLIGVEGRIQTRNYENNQGQLVYVTEVVADNISLLSSRNQQQNQGQSNFNQQTPYEAPQNQQNNGDFGNFNAGMPFESDPNMPF